MADPFAVGKRYAQRVKGGTKKRPIYYSKSDALSGFEVEKGSMPTRDEASKVYEGYEAGAKVREGNVHPLWR